jgi:hypothetical protein
MHDGDSMTDNRKHRYAITYADGTREVIEAIPDHVPVKPGEWHMILDLTAIHEWIMDPPSPSKGGSHPEPVGSPGA